MSKICRMICALAMTACVALSTGCAAILDSKPETVVSWRVVPEARKWTPEQVEANAQAIETSCLGEFPPLSPILELCQMADELLETRELLIETRRFLGAPPR